MYTKKLVVAAAMLASVALHAPSVSADVSSTAVNMSFAACLETIKQGSIMVAHQIPISVVDTDVLRIVRFATSDGSVLVTCSKPDNKMIVTKSIGIAPSQKNTLTNGPSPPSIP